MNYFVNPVRTDDDDFLWCVVESKTNQIIDSLEFEDEAEEYCQFLNAGGAFDGDTPKFMLTPVMSSHLNREFLSAFDQ